jgi:hypothetical protein
MHLAFDLGVSSNDISQITIDKLREILCGNQAFNTYIDYAISHNFSFAFTSNRGITKHMAKRSIELVLEKSRDKEKPTDMVKVELVPYQSIKTMILDEELQHRLSEPDLELFLIGCGYQTKPLTNRQLKSSSGGFNKNISGVLYVVKFVEVGTESQEEEYEEGEEPEPPFEFIKYGIINEVDVNKRTKEQVRRAKRDNIEYKTELLFLTKRLQGDLIAELETKIDSLTRAFYKVPKTMLPDGHSETTTLDKLPDILDIIYDYLSPEYLNN